MMIEGKKYRGKTNLQNGYHLNVLNEHFLTQVEKKFKDMIQHGLTEESLLEEKWYKVA